MSKRWSEYIVYKPTGGDARVKSGRSTIYYRAGDEAFYAAIEQYLIDATWVQKMSWENNTAGEQSYELSYTTSLSVTRGQEVTNSVNIGAEFKGLSISMDTSVKTFTQYESTDSQTKTVTVKVPPKSKLTFYQRKYRFRSDMSFILDAWGQEWNAGSWGGYDLTRGTCELEIFSEDYLTTDLDLNTTGAGAMDVKTVGKVAIAGITRKRENLTERAKNSLAGMGL